MEHHALRFIDILEKFLKTSESFPDNVYVSMPLSSFQFTREGTHIFFHYINCFPIGNKKVTVCLWQYPDNHGAWDVPGEFVLQIDVLSDKIAEEYYETFSKTKPYEAEFTHTRFIFTDNTISKFVQLSVQMEDTRESIINHKRIKVVPSEITETDISLINDFLTFARTEFIKEDGTSFI